jgi:hypothetical protein
VACVCEHGGLVVLRCFRGRTLCCVSLFLRALLCTGAAFSREHPLLRSPCVFPAPWCVICIWFPLPLPAAHSPVPAILNEFAMQHDPGFTRSFLCLTTRGVAKLHKVRPIDQLARVRGALPPLCLVCKRGRACMCCASLSIVTLTLVACRAMPSPAMPCFCRVSLDPVLVGGGTQG